MSENIRIGYINHFCHHSHQQITEAYEAMCDEEEENVVTILTNLKKFINETIRDYQAEIDASKASCNGHVHPDHNNDRCSNSNSNSK